MVGNSEDASRSAKTDAADAAEMAAIANGFATAFSACAEAFLNEPSERVVSDVRAVAQAFGDESLDDIAFEDGMVLRYNDRMFVTNSPLFVPLHEGCVALGGEDDHGVMRYASVESSRRSHVARCYRTVGFDERALSGFAPAVESLHEDSLAAELAFLAYLKSREAAAWESGETGEARRWAGLAARFLREHAKTWMSKAASCLASGENDFYARTCRLAALLCEAAAD